jgi:hypothetical protein
VYPGDANDDQIVNKSDILAIGLAYGYQGDARQNPTPYWCAQSCAPWNGNIPGTNVNSKHADCTGNGVVNMSDFNAVFYNWGESHHATPPPNDHRPSTGIDLKVLFVQDSLQVEHDTHEYPFEAEIWVGNSTLAAADLYGLAFTINYDPSLLGGSPLTVQYENDWFGTNGSSGVTKLFAVDNRNLGKLDIALTRLNHQSVNGFGRVAKISGGVIGENIHGRNIRRFLRFNISGIEGVGASGNARDLVGINDSLMISSNYMTNTSSRIGQTDDFKLVPNPVAASQALNLIGLNTDFDYTITNMVGQVIRSEKNSTTHAISTANLQQGCYLMTITTENGSLTKPFFVK